MSEPIWNPAFEPGYDPQENLSGIISERPGPGPAPTGNDNDSLAPQAASVVSSFFVSHPSSALAAGTLFYPQGHLEPQQEAPAQGPDHDRGDEPEPNAGRDADRESVPVKPSWAKRLSGLAVLARVAWQAAGLSWNLMRRFPRASLATGLSVVILVSVMLLQPGKGKNDTTTEIKNSGVPDQSTSSDPAKKTNAKPPAADSGSTTPPAPEVAKAGPPPLTPVAGPIQANSNEPRESAAARPAPPPLVDARADKAATGAAQSTPAPAPPPSTSDPLALPAVEPVKLTAGEGPVPLPSIEDPGSKPSDSKELAPAPPLMELAAADAGPATAALAAAHGSPAPAPPTTPAPALAPAPTPALAPAPAPTAAPALAPAAKPAPVDKQPAPAPSKDTKAPAAKAAPAPPPSPTPASHSGAATVGTAAVAGSVGLAVGTGLGTAISALSKGNGAKPKDQVKVEARPDPAKPAAKADPMKTAGTGDGAHVEPSKAGAMPAPSLSSGEKTVASDELPPLHPVTDPVPSSPKDRAVDAPIQTVPPTVSPAAEPGRRAEISSASALPEKKQEPAKEGWVPMKHSSGAAVQEVERETPGIDDGAQPKAGKVSTDPIAAADSPQSFDVETPRRNSADLASNMPSRKSGRAEGKLDTVLHKVEGKENFWDISRMYYNSGRYYKALWMANLDKVPQIDKLYRGTVLRIPPPEDLDPAYIEPAGNHTQRLAQNEPAGQNVEAESPRRSVEHTASRQDAAAGDGVPIRRSSRSEVDLNLPVSDLASDDSGTKTSSSRGGRRNIATDADEPEVRPRDAVTRPIYKVRQYDTLRTIARDTLGDSRRAREILELNREIIDDPGHLIVGQILELPEDARPARTRSAR